MYPGRRLKLFLNGELIAAARTKSVSLGRDAIDETDGEDNGWQYLNRTPDGRSISVSVEGVTTAANFSLLEQFFVTGAELPAFHVNLPDDSVLATSGGAFLESLSYNGTQEGATLFSATFVFSGAKSAAIPILTALDPDQVEEDSGQFTLTLSGLNFDATSVVELDGSPITTVFVSPMELQATVPASAITDPGTISVTVTTPDVGTSNALPLTVTDVIVYATWDAATHSNAIVLSNGNLTATRQANNNNVFASVRATIGKSSGKWYWEFTIGVNGQLQHMPGSARSTLPNNNYPGQTATSYGYQSQQTPTATGLTWNNALSTTGFPRYDPLTNPVINMALDMDNGRLWWGVNGSWLGSGNPATGSIPTYSGLSGTMFPAYGLFRSATLTNLVSVTANFGQSPFVHSVPAGFNAGVF